MSSSDSIFPADEFDPEAYRRNHPDLHIFKTQAELFNHFSRFGVNEPRAWTEISDRGIFLELLRNREPLLEIGVFDRPSLEVFRQSGVTVHYADWLDQQELVERAKGIQGRSPENVPEITHVLKNGYKQIAERYDAVISHHCVEHQSNLVNHFLDVRSILNKGGWYLFSLPDKRFSFDHFIQESNIVDILDAHLLGREAPSFKSVLEHRCFTSQSFQDGVNPFASTDLALLNRARAALSEFRLNKYVDVHCWQFTPSSFRRLYEQLADLELVPKPKEMKVYPARGEFYVAIAF
jgi:hypothetical protein